MDDKYFKYIVSDVFEFLDNLKDESVDLIIADPPYNVLDVQWDKFESEEKFFEFSVKWISSSIKKLKSTGSIYIFNTPYNSAFFLLKLNELGLHYKNWIVWHKTDGFSASKKKYVNNQEAILFFTKTNNYTFNYDDIREPYDSIKRIKHAKEKGILKNGKRWFPNEKGKLMSDVWKFTSQRHFEKKNGKIIKGKHPTPKPELLIEKIIKASTNEGDVVLDLFAGTGTTSYVSKNLGRIFIANDFDIKNKEFFISRMEKRDNDKLKF